MKRRTVSVEYEGQVYSYTYADRLKRRKITKWLVLALMVFVVGLVMPVTPEEVNRTMTHFKIVRAVACSAPLLLLGFGYWAGCSDAYQLGWNEGQDFMEAMQLKQNQTDAG